MSTEPRTVSWAGRAFHLGSVVLALGVGALQMFQVRGGFLTNYGADVFGTASFGWVSQCSRNAGHSALN